MAEEFLKSGKKHPSTAKKTRRARFKEEREDVKRADAEERQAASNSLSLMDKIAKLDRRLGPNVGATKERARLKNTLENKALAEETAKKASEAKKSAKSGKSDKTDHLKKAIHDQVKTLVKEVTEAAVQEALKKAKSEKKARKNKS